MKQPNKLDMTINIHVLFMIGVTSTPTISICTEDDIRVLNKATAQVFTIEFR